MGRLDAWAARPGRVVVVVVLATLLHGATLFGGFAGDDYVHQLVLEGGIEHRTLRPWALYDFGVAPSPGEPAWETGFLPWWTDADWYLRFVRPVTSVSIWLDQAIYGRWAVGYHVTNLALFGVLLGSAFGLYRRLGMPGGAALLAVMLLAVEDSVIFPVAWIANRNSLLAAVLTVWAVRLVAGIGGRVGWRVLGALVVAAVACGAKESGVVAFGAVAWLLVWRRHVARQPLRLGWMLVGVLGCVGLAVTYAVLLKVWGVGARSLAYPTPWGSPGAYLGHLGLLLTVGLVSLISAVPFSLMWLVPELAVPAAVAAVAILAGLVALAWRHVCGWPAWAFFAGWVGLAVVPQAGAPPADRLLFVAAVGGSALVAMVIWSAWRDGRRVWWRVRGHGLAVVVLIGAGVVPAVSTVRQEYDGMRRGVAGRRAILAVDVDRPSGEPCEIIALQMSPLEANVQTSQTWWLDGGDRGVRVWPMQYEWRGLAWTRVDARTFELAVAADEEPLAGALLENVFRTATEPMAEGRMWRVPAFTVEAVGVDATGLRRVRVRLLERMESRRYRFVVPRDGRWVALDPPAVGQTVAVDRPTTLAAQLTAG